MSQKQDSLDSLPESVQLLLKAGRVLSSTLEPEKLLKIILELAAEVVQAEVASILFVDERTQDLIFNVALGSAQNQLKEIRLKSGEGVAGWVAKEKKSLIVNDPPNDPRWIKKTDEKTNFVTRSILCVPMVNHGVVLGVVQTLNKKNSSGFSEFDKVLLEAFAAQTAIAVQNSRYVATLNAEKIKSDTVFSQMTEGSIYFNENYLASFVNPSACRLLGVKAEDLMRTNMWEVFEDFSLTPPWQELQKTSTSKIEFTAEYSKAYNLILNGIMKKIYSDKKEWIGTLFVFRDVTQIRKEENLKRSFLALISHKLRTPLSIITGYVPLLLEDSSLEKMPDSFKKAVKAIGQQGTVLKQLVEKLLAFSSLEANAVTMDKKSFSAQFLLQDLLSSMQSYLCENNVEVIWKGDWNNLPQLWVDYDMFGEIFKGLIENAVKFNLKSNKDLICLVKTDEWFIHLSVIDNGPGIAMQEQEKIFTNFYQIEEFFTGKVEGAGLGLTLVRRLVEMHGGNIHVESVLGQGSTFTVSFPLEKNKETVV